LPQQCSISHQPPRIVINQGSFLAEDGHPIIASYAPNTETIYISEANLGQLFVNGEEYGLTKEDLAIVAGGHETWHHIKAHGGILPPCQTGTHPDATQASLQILEMLTGKHREIEEP